MSSQGAIDFLQGNQISNGSQRYQIKILAQIRLRAISEPTSITKTFTQGNQQEEGHTNTGQVLKGEIRVMSLGVDHCQGLRQCVWWLVMVSYDQIDAVLFSKIGFSMSRHTTVNGDDNPCPLFCGFCQSLRRESISITQT